MAITQEEIDEFTGTQTAGPVSSITEEEVSEFAAQPPIAVSSITEEDVAELSASQPEAADEPPTLIRVNNLLSRTLLGTQTENPNVNILDTGPRQNVPPQQLTPGASAPTIQFDQEAPDLTIRATPGAETIEPPAEIGGLEEEPRRPALKFLAAPPLEEPAEPKLPRRPRPKPFQAMLDETRAFIEGGPRAVRKLQSRQQAALALREQPLSADEGFELSRLTGELAKYDPSDQVGAAQYLLDNFNQGMLGDLALEPRLPPELTGAAGTAYQIAGSLAHIQGYGLKLIALDKLLRAPEVTKEILRGVASQLENSGAEKSFEFLIKHRKIAADAIRSGLVIGGSEAISTPTEEDTLLKNLAKSGTRAAKGFGTGATLGVAFRGVATPIKAIIKSPEAQAFATSASFGGLVGLTLPVKTDIREDPWQWSKEKLANAGLTAAAFSISHALWRAYPKRAERYFKWKNKVQQKAEPTLADMKEVKQIFDELETLTLRSKINQEASQAPINAALPFFGETTAVPGPPDPSKIQEQREKEFVSPASILEEPPTRAEMIRSSTPQDIPVPGSQARLVELLNSNPLDHPEGIGGYTKEVKALGEAGRFKGVIKPVGIFIGRVAPLDIRAVREGTYKPLIKNLQRASDVNSIEANEFNQNIDSLFDVLHTAKGAKTKAQKEAVNKEAFRKMQLKSLEYNPRAHEKNPVVADIMAGFRTWLDAVQSEENKLGYKYDAKDGYAPELAKTREALREIQENRVKFATRRDVVSGEVFNPSALHKTGRSGTVEDLQLQLKFRARAFSQVKNLSAPALEYATKLAAMREFLHPETQAELDGVYNLLVKHQRSSLDKNTDNTLNGILGYISKVTPGVDLVERFGGEGVSRRLSGKSGQLKSQSFFPYNLQYYIRNRAQISQIGSLTSPRDLLSGMFKNLKDFPELEEMTRTDPELALLYQRVKSGEHSIDAPRGEKGFWNKATNSVVGRSHMSNMDGSLIAGYLYGQRKVAQGKWTPEQAKEHIPYHARLAQYAYDPTRVPKVFNSALGREFFRFKSWGINKIFYLDEHVHRLKTGTTGLGAPLDKSDRVNSALQLIWEAGWPSIKQGIKVLSVLQILNQMRAVNAIPQEAGDLFGDSADTMEALLAIAFEDDKKKRAKAKKFLMGRAALSYVPGGHSVLKKLYQLPERGFEKTFLVSPSMEDYRQWRKARRDKINLFEEPKPLDEGGF